MMFLFGYSFNLFLIEPCWKPKFNILRKMSAENFKKNIWTDSFLCLTWGKLFLVAMWLIYYGILIFMGRFLLFLWYIYLQNKCHSWILCSTFCQKKIHFIFSLYKAIMETKDIIKCYEKLIYLTSTQFKTSKV